MQFLLEVHFPAKSHLLPSLHKVVTYIWPQTSRIAEPVFANIRTNKRLDRFTLRGKIKVNIQWLLYCLVHNMEKILNYGLAPA